VAVASRQGPWVLDPDFPLVLDQGADAYDSDSIYGRASRPLRPPIRPLDPPGGVFVTKNHGQAWVRRIGSGGTALTSSDGTFDDYSAIAVDPRNRDIAYVTRSVFEGGPGGHVFKTANAGQGWTDISGNLPDLPTWSVTVNDRNGDIYVGNDNGVYVLPGGNGTTWQRM